MTSNSGSKKADTSQADCRLFLLKCAIWHRALFSFPVFVRRSLFRRFSYSGASRNLARSPRTARVSSVFSWFCPIPTPSSRKRSFFKTRFKCCYKACILWVSTRRQWNAGHQARLRRRSICFCSANFLQRGKYGISVDSSCFAHPNRFLTHLPGHHCVLDMDACWLLEQWVFPRKWQDSLDINQYFRQHIGCSALLHHPSSWEDQAGIIKHDIEL